MSIFNKARFDNNNQDNTRYKRFVHSPLTTEHNGIGIQIKEDGKIILQKEVHSGDAAVIPQEPLFDEIEIPVSLVYKLITLIEATRKVTYVNKVSRSEESK